MSTDNNDTCSICRFVPFQSISERIYVPTDDTVLMRLSFIMARQKIIYNRHFVHCHIQMLPIFIIKHFRTHFLMSALLAIFFCHCHTYIIHSYVLIGKSIFFSSHICNIFFFIFFWNENRKVKSIEISITLNFWS